MSLHKEIRFENVIRAHLAAHGCIFSNVESLFPAGLDYPSITSTEDGNIILEWIRPHARIELEVNITDNKLELYATNMKAVKFEEKLFTTEQWLDAIGRVSELLAPTT